VTPMRAHAPRLRAMLPPLERLLAAGGDARLELDRASGLNIYGCRPAPRPDALNFSSSTASSISEVAWQRADAVRERIAEQGLSDSDALVEEIREELARLLGLGQTGTAIVFAPSGTDAMLHALAIARVLHARPVTSILAAADETGSGARNAVAGRHFCAVTAYGRRVVPGEAIAGLGDGIASVRLALRDAAGAARSLAERDADALAAVRREAAAGRSALLYAMDHSKLGNCFPSAACLEEIGATFGRDATIVVDACQARLGLSRLHWHLARGHMVLLTGSKFFAGPPLSGALIVPEPVAARLRDAAALPDGLVDYSVASDWPREWRGVRAALPQQHNIGQLLRWHAALAEIALWLGAPAERRRTAIRDFAAACAHAFAGCAALAPLARAPVLDDDFPAPTIFPFLVRRDGRALSAAECVILHRALNRDVAGLLPGTLPARARRIAALPCHIGQPVVLPGGSAALRISASAQIVDAPPRRIADDLGLICDKIELLLGHFDAVADAF
jgi:hypothetical protein